MIAREYGVTVSSEPTFYSYDDGRAHRPDLTFHLGNTAVATDFTVVAPGPVPGAAAEKADKDKKTQHDAATANAGHEFIPCATEMYGAFGKGWKTLLSRLNRHIAPHLQFGFRQSMTHAFSTALASGRADAVRSAATRTRSW
jgi:hypothetical protein